MIEAAVGRSSRVGVRRHQALLATLVIAVIGAGLGGTVSAQSADVLTMVNGDTLTGEIKSLDRGMLRFDTDATDTIEVKWTHVAALTSEQNFLITLDDDREVFGSLTAAAQDGRLLLRTSSRGNIDLSALAVVRMSPVEGRLLDQIDLRVDLGYNLTKANSVTQTNLGVSFGYRSEERFLSADLQATRSSSRGEEPSMRSNSTFSYRRFNRNRRWDPLGFGNVEQNDELGLDRRVTLGGAMSRWLADTNSHRVSFMGGLVATRENEFDAVDTDESVEATVGLSLDWFRYDDPELDVSMTLSVYERLSGDSRTRGNLDVDLRWELINDFYWGFSTYYSFNTRPVGEGVSNKDYGVVTTLGWSF